MSARIHFATALALTLPRPHAPGGPGSDFYTDIDQFGNEYAASACGYATDRTDCEAIAGLRVLESLGPLSYAYPGQPHAPMPLPPPGPPRPPPPTPPDFDFLPCANTCGYTTQCSDGGMGAYLVEDTPGIREFKCNYGTQVHQRASL